VNRQAQLKDLYRAYIRDPAFAHMRKPGIGFVPGRGSMQPEAVIVGEAPGRHENGTRKPFMGPAGQILNEMLRSVELTRQDVFITNVVKYRPVIGQIQLRNRTPSAEEIEASRRYLLQELDVFDATPVIVLGNSALRALLMWAVKRPNISSYHGKVWYDADRMYYAFYHPAVAVYDPSQKTRLIDDFQQAITKQVD
jgi:uracil-DNA glycosylase